MKRNLRRICIWLALLMAVQMTACGGTEAETTADIQADTAVTEAAETEPETLALGVEKTDYEGYTVNYLTLANYPNHFFLLCDEGDGDQLVDAAYRRNLAVSDLLNVNFTATEVDNVQTTASASVMAGGGEYDYILPHANAGVVNMVTDGILTDWNTIPSVDMTGPWWNGRMQETLGIDGRMFYASGDIVMTWQGMGAYLFNKDYIADYGLDTDMYEYVYDGTWTIDKLLTLTSGMYSDLNGDGKADKDDQYGLLANLGGTYWVQFGFEQPISTRDESNYPVLAMGTERMIKVVERYYEMLYAADTWRDSFSSSTYATSDYRNMLMSGRSFLTFFDIGGLHSYLREIDFEFGILPMVKLDEAQEGYHSFCGAGLIGVPKASPNLQRTGDVAEALAYYSYYILRPAFFDTVLQNKLLRDEDSYNMLSMMHDNKVFDFGFNYDSTAAEALKTVVIQKKSTDFASYYASIEQKVTNNFQKIYDSVKEQ